MQSIPSTPIYNFTIPGRLASENEFIAKNRLSPYAGNKLKADAMKTVGVFIKHDLKGVTIESPVYIRYKWFEKNRRRDHDNVAAFGHKVIQDALIECGVLKDDGWGYVIGFMDDFYLDARNPRIEVQIEEVIR